MATEVKSGNGIAEATQKILERAQVSSNIVRDTEDWLNSLKTSLGEKQVQTLTEAQLDDAAVYLTVFLKREFCQGAGVKILRKKHHAINRANVNFMEMKRIPFMGHEFVVYTNAEHTSFAIVAVYIDPQAIGEKIEVPASVDIPETG